MTWPTLAADAIKSGLIRSPFSKRVASSQFYWLATSAARSPTANIRAFGRWLREERAADCVA
jgi:hypothetical protein